MEEDEEVEDIFKVLIEWSRSSEEVGKKLFRAILTSAQTKKEFFTGDNFFKLLYVLEIADILSNSNPNALAK